MGKLSLAKQVGYGCGMMGWSVMINLVSVILIYLYFPPSNSGLPKLISQVVIFGIFNSIAIISAGGRLIDALYDPFIAHFSDQSRNPKGRRIPLMKVAILPSLFFCFFVFYPLKQEESLVNTAWLGLMLIGFYVASTTFIIPYNALLPELSASPSDNVKLATWQSVGYILGIGIASNAFFLAEIFRETFGIGAKISALQASVFCIALLGAICMFITTLVIDEKQILKRKTISVPLRLALRQTLGDKNFLLFLLVDFTYFISGTFITSGLMFFITVLLGLHESMGNKIMIALVLISLFLYPIVNLSVKKFGKKIITVFSFAMFSFVFLCIYFLGKLSIDPFSQLYILVFFAAIPMASLSILPNAILSEIIQKDQKENNQSKEALYFAVRYFFAKIAQTIGIGLFAMFLVYGKEVGNDFGIRLGALFGCGLCFAATVIFTKFREIKTVENVQDTTPLQT
jgi:GPH family glycoside/pentoside/hexuronide:cation symporter